MRHGHSSWALVLLGVAACGHYSSFTPTHKPPHALSPRAPDTVEFFTATQPERPYVDIGVLASGHESSFSTSSELEVMNALRKQAADVGCDAVVVTDEHSRMFAMGNQAWSTKDFNAICAVYTDAGVKADAKSGAEQ